MSTFNKWIADHLVTSTDQVPSSLGELVASMKKHVNCSAFDDEMLTLIVSMSPAAQMRVKMSLIDSIVNGVISKGSWSSPVDELTQSVGHIRARLSATYPGKYSTSVAGGKLIVVPARERFNLDNFNPGTVRKFYGAHSPSATRALKAHAATRGVNLLTWFDGNVVVGVIDPFDVIVNRASTGDAGFGLLCHSVPRNIKQRLKDRLLAEFPNATVTFDGNVVRCTQAR